MSNRRSGGSMGGNRGNTNRNSYQSSFQSNVNPWQGGGMNQGGGGGFLSQLTTNPQQLALALSTLLQPQAQAPQPLMSMNNSSMNRGSNFDRFGNRGRDIRRHEPYNKNRGFNNRNRNQQNRKKDDKKDDAKKDKNDDQSMDEEDKKRDWKDEKKSAEDDDDKSDKEGDESGKGNKEGRFYKIPPQFLTCFVCNKQMWDGESMEKHLKGRAHSEMIKSLEESIGITVNILRENMRLVEERNRIELFRIQRTKKYNKFRGQEEHCNMCDLAFRGKMSSHRRGEGHQRLKRYLHPKCTRCDMEFHARIEWIEHRLTPEHLRKHVTFIEELGENNPRPSDGAKVITDLDEEESQEMDLDKLLLEATAIDNENPILELDDTLENIQNRYPAYKADRPVSTKSLEEFSGFVCTLCNRSFTQEEHSKQHLMSQVHYYKFIEAIKQKWDEKEKREREEREEAKRKAKEEAEKAENGDGEEQNGEAEEGADQELDETLNDSAMETADETLNDSQEDIVMNDSQESQLLEDEGDDVEIIPEAGREEKGAGRKTPAAKTGPAAKRAAAAAAPAKPAPPAPVPAPAKATPPAARGRKV